MEEPAYDAQLVEQILHGALELMRHSGFSVSMEHGVGGPAETSVSVETNDCYAPFTAYRVVTDFEGMPAAFATSAILSHSRTKDFNEFTVRETEIAQLEAAPPEDLQNIGAVSVHEDHANYLGWLLESFMLRATRRLPDGSAFGIRVPVEREGGIWTPRRYREKMRTLSAWHIAGPFLPPGEGLALGPAGAKERGCSLGGELSGKRSGAGRGTAMGARASHNPSYTFLALEKPRSFVSYLPGYMVRQLFCRLLAKYTLRVRRIVLQAIESSMHLADLRALLSRSLPPPSPLRPLFRPQEFAADGCAGVRAPRSLRFASGSAGVPLHWGARRLSLSVPHGPGIGAGPAPSPFVLHSFAPRGAPAALGPGLVLAAASAAPAAPAAAPAGPPQEAGEQPSKATEIFFDLVGVERRGSEGPWSPDGGASWVRPPGDSSDGSPYNYDAKSPLVEAGQVLRAEAQEMREPRRNPGVLSRTMPAWGRAACSRPLRASRLLLPPLLFCGAARRLPPLCLALSPSRRLDSVEAARASLELSLRLESMSLAELAPAPAPAPAAGAAAGAVAGAGPSALVFSPLAPGGDDQSPPAPALPVPPALFDAPPPAYAEGAASVKKARARCSSDALAEGRARPPAPRVGGDSSPRSPHPPSSRPAPARPAFTPPSASGFAAFLNERLSDAVKEYPGVPLGSVVDRLRAEWGSMPEEERAGSEPATVSVYPLATQEASRLPLAYAVPQPVRPRAEGRSAPGVAGRPLVPWPAGASRDRAPRGPARSQKRASPPPKPPRPIVPAPGLACPPAAQGAPAAAPPPAWTPASSPPAAAFAFSDASTASAYPFLSGGL
eukprot:tig00021038_g17536.t1